MKCLQNYEKIIENYFIYGHFSYFIFPFFFKKMSSQEYGTIMEKALESLAYVDLQAGLRLGFGPEQTIVSSCRCSLEA